MNKEYIKILYNKCFNDKWDRKNADIDISSYCAFCFDVNDRYNVYCSTNGEDCGIYCLIDKKICGSKDSLMCRLADYKNEYNYELINSIKKALKEHM